MREPARTPLIGVAFLAVGIAATYSGGVRAAIIPVTNCSDNGAGSLRGAVAAAVDGDTVDLRGLQCNYITLTSGQIHVPQSNLTFVSRKSIYSPARPDAELVRVDGSLVGRVFWHTGTGTLRIDGLWITNGRYAANVATGGCIHSEGNVELNSALVQFCNLFGEGGSNPMALGGGVHANTVLARHSYVNSNHARGVATHGGGISTEGRATIFHSDVSNNTAMDGAGVSTLGGATITYSFVHTNFATRSGGALEAFGSVTVNKSMIRFNRAAYRCGGLCIMGTGRTTILDSTFSLNEASYLSAGSLSDHTTISNSTIAFNRDTSINECAGAIRARYLTLQSTIVAKNACEADPRRDITYDVGGRPWEGYLLKGANNLIGRSRVDVPADTISADPRLVPTSTYNGGPTPTHALLPDSPAIDRGNNVFNRLYDQRGPGFPRVKGLRADIGAFEF